ncbi:MAG: hypothetical protein K8S27_09625 [Candidatus Omnitrophica bacterium]|nr:hypothetical protein [Candidatus Omnitrophota bacterium]
MFSNPDKKRYNVYARLAIQLRERTYLHLYCVGIVSWLFFYLVDDMLTRQPCGQWIPTISEVFAAVPDTKKIFIEIKCGPRIVAPLLDRIEQSELRPDQIVISSLQARVIQALKIQTVKYKALWLSGFKKDPDGKIIPALEDILRTLQRIQADGLSSSPDIPAEFIRGITSRGYEYHVWAVDDLETAKRFKTRGAASITTNVPGQLKMMR